MSDRYMLPTANTLPHYGMVRLRRYGPWVPCCLYSTQDKGDDGTPLGDATYWAWIAGETYRLPDPDLPPHWPWEPIEAADYVALRTELGL